MAGRREYALAAALLVVCIAIGAPQLSSAQGAPPTGAPPTGAPSPALSSNIYEVVGAGQFSYKSGYTWRAPPPRRPPPFRRPPPGIYHNPDLTEMQVRCVQKADKTTNVVYDDPNCNIPKGAIATGKDADAFREQYSIMNGDQAILNLTESPQGQARRRYMHEGVYTPLAASGTLFAGLQLNNFSITQPGEQKEIYVGEPIDLRTIIAIMDFTDCGSGPSWVPMFTRADLEKVLFNPSAANSMEKYYMTCSYGKSLFKASNTKVVGPIKAKCRGAVLRDNTGRPPFPPRPPPRPPSSWFILPPRKNETVDDWWDTSAWCTASEQAYWERAAEAAALAQAEDEDDDDLRDIMKYTNRRRNVIVVPPAVKCAWAGYADVTCTTPTCSAIIKGGQGPNGVHLFMHELMHNYGLEHSGYMGNEYGDDTDVMGNFNFALGGPLCPNPASLYRIGWAKPLVVNGGAKTFNYAQPGLYGNLTAGNFTAKNPITNIVLPAAGTSDDHFVSVNLGILNNVIGARAIAMPAYFISYRVKNKTLGGFDSGLQSKHDGKVIIYSYDGKQTERQFGKKPQLMDWGIPFQRPSGKPNVWKSAYVPDTASPKLGGAVQITVTKIDGNSATIDICRQTEMKETSCSNGLDDDCDGNIDGFDSDC